MFRNGSVLASLALAALALALVVAPVSLDPRALPGDLAAHALDLFGGDDDDTDDERALDPFWVDGAGGSAPVPLGLPDFASLAERVSPAVVNVKTLRTGSGPRVPHGMEEFFGSPFGGRGGGEYQVPSLGSGFVISPDGYIVTNNHVIEDVDKIVVAFNSGEELEATVVGRDPKTDIALIKVEAAAPL